MDGLDSQQLYKERFTVAMPSTHRLAQRSSIKVGDLDNETLLLLEDGHCLRDQALDICASTAVHEKQDFRATSLETLRQMVAAGVGITLLPELAGRGAYGNARGVAIKPFAKPVPTRTIGAVWRKSTARRAAILALCRQIEAHAL
jgi:LysR family hydrogen peroxide-inducible transcriptional activator